MNLFCFGLGYCADYLSAKLIKQGWHVSATCRTPEKAAIMEASGIRPVLLSGKELIPTELGNADHVLLSCLLYTSPSPRDRQKSRMPSSA